jgi:hypothetical protein
LHRLGVIGLLLLLGACSGADLTWQLVFPDQESFLISEFAALEIYEGGEDPAARCAQLNTGQPIGESPLFVNNRRPVCDLRDQIQLGSVEEGSRLFFAQVEDASEAYVLRGCTPILVGESDGPIAIQLEKTDAYPDPVALSCSSEEEKCTQDVACSP